MYQTKLATLVLCLEHAYEFRADEVADLLPLQHSQIGVQSVSNRILTDKNLENNVRASLIGLLARLLKVLPPTLHPHLPQHLIETVAKEGDGTIRESLSALLHASSNQCNNLPLEYQLEALIYALKNCDLEFCTNLLDNCNILEANSQASVPMSSSMVQCIGLLGIRFQYARSACITLLQRVVLWSEGETAQEALGYLLDLLYVGDFNEEIWQCYMNLFSYFGRAKRYETQATLIAYGILRHIQAAGHQKIWADKLEEMVCHNQTNPAITRLVECYENSHIVTH